jgi:hypothetical protein
MAASKKKTIKKEEVPIFASEEQLREVRQEIKDLERMLEEDKRRKEPKIQDVSSVQAEILKKQQYVMRHSPTTLRGEASNKAYKEAKELEKLIKDNMLPSNKFYQKSSSDKDSHLKYRNFEDAVRQQIKFQTDPKLKQATLKYKYLMSRITGGDPAATNLERLRPNR